MESLILPDRSVTVAALIWLNIFRRKPYNNIFNNDPMKNRIQNFGVLLLFLSFGQLMTGCKEPRPDGFPEIHPVTLHVTQEGKPLGEAAISLFASDGSTWSIGGTTDNNGNAQITTHGKFVGAPLGQFKVVIRKQINEGEDEYNEAMNRQDLAAAAKIDVKVFAYVDDVYNSPQTTPVEIEIKKGDKVIEIDAGTSVKIQKEFLR